MNADDFIINALDRATWEQATQGPHDDEAWNDFRSFVLTIFGLHPLNRLVIEARKYDPDTSAITAIREANNSELPPAT